MSQNTPMELDEGVSGAGAGAAAVPLAAFSGGSAADMCELLERLRAHQGWKVYREAGGCLRKVDACIFDGTARPPLLDNRFWWLRSAAESFARAAEASSGCARVIPSQILLCAYRNSAQPPPSSRRNSSVLTLTITEPAEPETAAVPLATAAVFPHVTLSEKPPVPQPGCGVVYSLVYFYTPHQPLSPRNLLHAGEGPDADPSCHRRAAKRVWQWHSAGHTTPCAKRLR